MRMEVGTPTITVNPPLPPNAVPYEMILFARILTRQERDRVTEYLLRKWR